MSRLFGAPSPLFSVISSRLRRELKALAAPAVVPDNFSTSFWVIFQGLMSNVQSKQCSCCPRQLRGVEKSEIHRAFLLVCLRQMLAWGPKSSSRGAIWSYTCIDRCVPSQVFVLFFVPPSDVMYMELLCIPWTLSSFAKLCTFLQLARHCWQGHVVNRLLIHTVKCLWLACLLSPWLFFVAGCFGQLW